MRSSSSSGAGKVSRSSIGSSCSVSPHLPLIGHSPDGRCHNLTPQITVVLAVIRREVGSVSDSHILYERRDHLAVTSLVRSTLYSLPPLWTVTIFFCSFIVFPSPALSRHYDCKIRNTICINGVPVRPAIEIVPFSGLGCCSNPSIRQLICVFCAYAHLFRPVIGSNRTTKPAHKPPIWRAPHANRPLPVSLRFVTRSRFRRDSGTLRKLLNWR